MSTAQQSKAPPTKPKKDRERDRERERKDRSALQPHERLKTVVRRLPPNLPEDIFWQSVQAWVNDESVTWKSYHIGKFRKRLNKENIPSRAYIAFRDEEQLAQFSREYDGHLFRDKAGNESQAVVEFSPYQKVPSEKKKADARNATIEKDEDYLSFVESLKAAANPEPVTLESLIAANRPPSPPKTTPLLEALKAEKSANKDKESILRNHAHYKDQSGAGVRAQDGKKKVGPPVQKAAESSTNNTSGKKPAKKQHPPTATTAPAAPGASSQMQQSAKLALPTAKGTANQSVKPTKPPRTPRQTQAAKSPILAVPASSTQATPATEDHAETSPATPTGPRRSRPVIGLASRHFEAALSGVGGEKRSRREREKERDERREKEGASVLPTPASAAVGSSSAAAPSGETMNNRAPLAPAPPLSPRRDRARREGTGIGVGNEQVKVSSILQRDAPPPAILQRNAETPGFVRNSSTAFPQPPVVSQIPVDLAEGDSRGGGGGRPTRRSRGRGRGGIPPGPPRGG